MKRTLWGAFSIVLILWFGEVWAGEWNVITSEEFVEKLSDRERSGTSIQRIDSIKIVKKRIPTVSVHILFKSGSTVIADNTSRRQLTEMAKALSSKNLLNFRFEIAGHTDSTGPAETNRKLSKQRAQLIKKKLCTKYNIPPERLVAKGYGESQPVAPNNTTAGRAKNRRVVIKRLE